MARDPVCGMNVRDDNKNNNLRSEWRGQQYHFCSDKCRQEFDRNPSNYVRDDNNDDNNRDRNDLRNNRDRNDSINNQRNDLRNNRDRNDNRPR